MSIYSGFATRQQEQTYNTLALDLIEVLQRRIIKFYLGQQVDQQKFMAVLSGLHHHLAKMEHSKYLEPKYSHSIKEVVALTHAVASSQPSQNPGKERQHNLAIPVPLALNFSRVQLEEAKEGGFGRIKHQDVKDTSKDSSFLSRGKTNPEQPFSKQRVKRASSTHFSKGYRSRRESEVTDNILENHSKDMVGEQQKKINNYLIREYVGRNKRWRLPKKQE